MKSDRELLELAAKACGELPRSWYGNNAYFDGVLTRWNPLTDDGDALRLAVSIPTLSIQWIIAEAWQAHQDQDARIEYVRRAIVRAAAAIGEAMQ